MVQHFLTPKNHDLRHCVRDTVHCDCLLFCALEILSYLAVRQQANELYVLWGWHRRKKAAALCVNVCSRNAVIASFEDWWPGLLRRCSVRRLDSGTVCHPASLRQRHSASSRAGWRHIFLLFHFIIIIIIIIKTIVTRTKSMDETLNRRRGQSLSLHWTALHQFLFCNADCIVLLKFFHLTKL